MESSEGSAPSFEVQPFRRFFFIPRNKTKHNEKVSFTLIAEHVLLRVLYPRRSSER